MNKNEDIAIGTKLRYKGRDLALLKTEQQHLIFLGYDSNGFNDIWVDHLGEHKFMSLDDVELAA